MGTKLDKERMLGINKQGWDQNAEKFYGEAALPRYGPLAQTEKELNLIGEVAGQSVLEIGCGSGHSLLYLAERGATELWGLDLSHAQIEFATTLLSERGYQPQLFESPMEENPGLPLNHFDLVISIYALGWTADLPRTLSRIAAYLKPGGRLVFSWEHPAFRCFDFDGYQFIIRRSYHDEGPELHESWLGVPIVQHPRKLSTYINSLIEAGLTIERVVESPVDPSWAQGRHDSPAYWYSVERAELIPTTFIIKARKPSR